MELGLTSAVSPFRLVGVDAFGFDAVTAEVGGRELDRGRHGHDVGGEMLMVVL